MIAKVIVPEDMKTVTKLTCQGRILIEGTGNE